MKTVFAQLGIAAAAIGCCIVGTGQAVAEQVEDITRVRMGTDAGDFVIEVYPDRAPKTAAFFLGLVDQGAYDGAKIYRSTVRTPHGKPLLIQGGVAHERILGTASPEESVQERLMLSEVETTSQTGLPHDSGTVSLARDLLGTGHVLPEFFICLEDAPELDENGRTVPDTKGFPAFARVVEGIEVVRAIAQRDTSGETPIPMLSGEILSEPVTITSVRIATDLEP